MSNIGVGFFMFHLMVRQGRFTAHGCEHRAAEPRLCLEVLAGRNHPGFAVTPARIILILGNGNAHRTVLLKTSSLVETADMLDDPGLDDDTFHLRYKSWLTRNRGSD